MAESDKIKRGQIIEDGIFKPTTTEVKELREEMVLLVDGFKDVIKTKSEWLKTNSKGQSSSEIKNQAAAIKELELARKAYNAAQLAQEKIEQQLIKNGTEQIKQDKELINLHRAKAAELKKEQKEYEKLNSEYKKGVDRLSQLKKELKELAYQERQNTEEFKRLSKEFTELDKKVRTAEESVGEFHRNVGNYKSGFNGLGNSINQITREMPAFANSVQTGFMAISNNLPIFFDEINKTRKGIEEMRAEGQKVPGVLSQLTSAFFSWGTALSIGVTLLTVYGKEIVNFVGNLFKAEGATLSLMEATKDHHEVMKDFFIRKRDLIFQDAIDSKKLTEEEVARLKTSSDLRLAIAKEEQSFSEARAKVAKELGVDLKNETGAIVKFFKDLVADPMTQKAYDSKKVEKFTQEESDLLVQLEERKKILEELYQIQLKTDLFSIKERENKKKATKELTDQDKRVLDEMQQLDKKRMDDKEKLAKWEEDLFNERKNWGDDTIWWDKENGITLDDHNQTLKDIEAAKNKARQDRINEVTEQIRFAQRVTQIYQQEIEKRANLEQQQLDRQIQQRERNIDRQVELAKNGLDNTVAYEEMKRAKAELARKESEEREARRKEAAQLAEAYMNALNARLKEPNANANTAPLKAAKDVILAKAIAKTLASFFDGTEDTGDGGNVDNKKGFLSVLHPNERVMTAEQNKKTEKNGKKLANETLADIAYKYNTGQLMEITPTYKMERKSTSENIANSLLALELRENNKYLKMIADKPVQVVDVDKLGNVYEKIYTGSTIKTIIHKPKTRI
jgi:predicted  nucleic acid-binding Zn-ribbon protein